MTSGGIDDLRSLEGRRVGVALADSSCIEDAVFEAVVRDRLWLHADGEDVFVELPDVVDVWELSPRLRRRDDGAGRTVHSG